MIDVSSLGILLSEPHINIVIKKRTLANFHLTFAIDLLLYQYFGILTF